MTEFERQANRLARRYKVHWKPVSGYYGRAYDMEAAGLNGYFRAPTPTAPMKYAIWLHELGHIAKSHGLNGSYPRWKEELEAWTWALNKYRVTIGLPPQRVRQRVRQFMRWSLDRALRRGAVISNGNAFLAKDRGFPA